jgi:hypothetical protein
MRGRGGEVVERKRKKRGGGGRGRGKRRRWRAERKRDERAERKRKKRGEGEEEERGGGKRGGMEKGGGKWGVIYLSMCVLFLLWKMLDIWPFNSLIACCSIKQNKRRRKVGKG